MKTRQLRIPEERVGTLPNGALPPPRVEPTLDDLLRRGLTGDDRALRAVVECLQPVMLDLATHHVRSRAEAEDVVQETWMAALRAVDRFQGRASMKTWLLRILTYRAITAARRAGRAMPMSQLGPRGGNPDDLGREPMWMDGPVRPDEVLTARDVRIRIDRLLATLPPQQRQVVELRDLEGFSTREVCDRLGLTSANQRVLLHRGRRRLRDEWQAGDPLPRDRPVAAATQPFPKGSRRKSWF